MLEDAKRSALSEIAHSLFADDAMRNRIALAEAERKLQSFEAAKLVLDEATKWVLSSASHEHLCQYHGVRARLALDEKQLSMAWSAVEEALQIAAESEFDLFRIEHLVTASRIRTAQNNPDEGLVFAEEALALAKNPEIGFVWGEKGALLAIAEAKKTKGDFGGSSEALGQVLELQRRIDDPNLIQTERLLADLSRGPREQ
jgi:hypothetical protein